MFGIGETELVIILAFGFMIFGPDKLPGMGRTIGRALRQFREAQEGFTQVVQSEVMDPLQDAMGDSLDSGTRQQRRATAEERAAALAQDADRDDTEVGEQRSETFAERKARLAAERKAREEQEASETAGVADAASSGDASVAGPSAKTPAAADTSAAALYSLGGRSSYGTSKEEESQAKASDDVKDDEAVATASEASAKAADTTTDRKEEGSAQA